MTDVLVFGYSYLKIWCFSIDSKMHTWKCKKYFWQMYYCIPFWKELLKKIKVHRFWVIVIFGYVTKQNCIFFLNSVILVNLWKTKYIHRTYIILCICFFGHCCFDLWLQRCGQWKIQKIVFPQFFNRWHVGIHWLDFQC